MPSTEGCVQLKLAIGQTFFSNAAASKAPCMMLRGLSNWDCLKIDSPKIQCMIMLPMNIHLNHLVGIPTFKLSHFNNMQLHGSSNVSIGAPDLSA